MKLRSGWGRMRRPFTLRLGYVAGDKVDAVFHRSCLCAVFVDAARRPRDRVFVGPSWAEGLYLEDNRTRLVDQFMGEPGDGLLSIDTDIEFPPDLPKALSDVMGARPEIGVLGVNVPLGCNPTSGYVRDQESGQWRPLLQLAPVPLSEVDAVATAIVVIRRSTLQRVIERFPNERPFDRYWSGGTHVGEDLAFCRRVKDCGERVFILRYPGNVRHWKRQPLSDDMSDVLKAMTAEKAEHGGGHGSA